MQENKNVTGLQHIGLPVRDMEQSVRFYASLGFEQAFATQNAGNKVVFVKQKNLILELYEQAETAGISGAIDHFALDVVDIEEAFEAVKALGHKMLDTEIQFLPFWDKGVRFFTILGPNAEKVEFSQMLT